MKKNISLGNWFFFFELNANYFNRLFEEKNHKRIRLRNKFFFEMYLNIK